MAIGSWFNQLAAITAMNLRNLPARIGTSLVAVIGIGGVVAVLVSPALRNVIQSLGRSIGDTLGL